MAEAQKPDKSNMPQPKTQAADHTETAKQADQDAVALLMADHRRAEDLFKQYEQATGRTAKQKLVDQICQELNTHTELEETIFYPACREAGVEDKIMDEAQVEHDSAKLLIAELQNGKPGESYFDAKVKVLSEYINHHVCEEESDQGIFAKVKSSGVDLNQVGQEIIQSKAQRSQDSGVKMPHFIALNPRAISGPETNYGSTANWKESSMPRHYYSEQDDNRSRRSYRSRDDEGRYSSGRGRDDDDDRRYSRSSYDDDRGRSRSNDRERDEYGRFMSEDDDRGRGRSRGNDRERDEYGRFTSSRDGDDDDYGRSRGHSGWFGDSRGHSEAARRGWQGRH